MTVERLTNLIKWLEELEPFSVDFIPEPPVVDKEVYDKHVVPSYIRCGAIPKNELVTGKAYFGSCRNADKAMWNGSRFEYERTKFCDTYTEKIKHFEDGGGSSEDVFVPIKEL